MTRKRSSRSYRQGIAATRFCMFAERGVPARIIRSRYALGRMCGKASILTAANPRSKPLEHVRRRDLADACPTKPASVGSVRWLGVPGDDPISVYEVADANGKVHADADGPQAH